MTDPTRRQFLVRTAAGLAALHGNILNATNVFAGENPAPMAIARWSGNPAGMTNDRIDEAAGKLARRAVEAAGGMKRFVKPGETVWVKPNICWDRTPEQAANTNPRVVAEIVGMCLEAGAKTVKVGDHTASPAQRTYVTSGIGPAVEKAGGKLVYVDASRFKTMAINGASLKEIPIYPEILECDAIINVAILKDHCDSKLTMCMKNLMGIVNNRQRFHQDIPGCLADIGLFMRPRIRLHVLDGVRILKAHGPTGGKLEDVVVKMALAAGTDSVAIDAWGAELAGFKPADIGSIVKGQERGLGKMDYRSLAPKEVAVS
ncbi:MAG: DUF362 domain-containing protein [Candidatus Sumerlaeia bacterium]